MYAGKWSRQRKWSLVTHILSHVSISGVHLIDIVHERPPVPVAVTWILLTYLTSWAWLDSFTCICLQLKINRHVVVSGWSWRRILIFIIHMFIIFSIFNQLGAKEYPKTIHQSNQMNYAIIIFVYGLICLVRSWRWNLWNREYPIFRTNFIFLPHTSYFELVPTPTLTRSIFLRYPLLFCRCSSSIIYYLLSHPNPTRRNPCAFLF